MAELIIDLADIEPAALLRALGEPRHVLRFEPSGAAVLVLPDVDQSLADAARAAYVPPPVTPEQVRAEAKRRLIALLGARDEAHLDVLIANGIREAVRLQEIRLAHLMDTSKPDLTAEQQLRAETLKAIDAAIEAIRSRSNALEAEPPSDYTADHHWN
jgi:hypothetical protein